MLYLPALEREHALEVQGPGRMRTQRKGPIRLAAGLLVLVKP